MPDLNCNYIFWGTSVFDSKNTYVYASFCRKTLGTCLDSGCDRPGFFIKKINHYDYPTQKETPPLDLDSSYNRHILYARKTG